MKRLKKILFLALMVAALSCLFCQPAFAISEEEVQAQVDAVGKEAVSGNVLIWFMCAIGFLKVSQKIDSFMASLGVNVGHTGGSMLAEAMIAARGFSGFKSFASNHFAGGRSSHSSHVRANGGGKGGAGFGAGFASGGLAGVIKRNVTNNAVKTATTPPDAKPSGLSGLVGGAAGGIGGHIYASSVSKGGNFANNVIGSVATGSITQMGTMTGDKAVEALHSYMGHAALEPGAENIPTYQNVEIGGGRITGTEVTPEHPEGIAFGMYHADQYDRALPDRRIRDYDNLSEKQLLDLLSSFVMADDTGLLCDAYNTAELGDQDCTKIYIMEKQRFPQWLTEHKTSLQSISDF